MRLWWSGVTLRGARSIQERAGVTVGIEVGLSRRNVSAGTTTSFRQLLGLGNLRSFSWLAAYEASEREERRGEERQAHRSKLNNLECRQAGTGREPYLGRRNAKAMQEEVFTVKV